MLAALYYAIKAIPACLIFGRELGVEVRTNRDLARVAKAAVGDMLVSEDVRDSLESIESNGRIEHTRST